MTFGALALSGLLAACKAPNVSVGTQVSIIRVEATNSRVGLPDSNALHDDATGAAYFPATRDEASAIARSLIAKGHGVDVGLGQYHFFPPSTVRSGMSVDDMLDPCTNVRVTGALLERCWLTAFAAVDNDRRREREALAGMTGCYNPGDGAYFGRVAGEAQTRFVRRVVYLYRRRVLAYARAYSRATQTRTVSMRRALR